MEASTNTNTPPPTPQVQGSGAPAQRLKQAEQHLKKGRGFEAFILLDDFPEGPQKEKVEKLLPLARFLFDMADGDGLTGLEALDDAYLDAAEALARRKPALALDKLLAALDVGETMDRPYTRQVIEGLFALLGEKHQVTANYREQLAAVGV